MVLLFGLSGMESCVKNGWHSFQCLAGIWTVARFQASTPMNLKMKLSRELRLERLPAKSLGFLSRAILLGSLSDMIATMMGEYLVMASSLSRGGLVHQLRIREWLIGLWSWQEILQMCNKWKQRICTMMLGHLWELQWQGQHGQEDLPWWEGWWP